MVYKIRNKSIFWTRAGWKYIFNILKKRNNWHPKNFNAPRPTNSENTMGMRCRYDHHSFLRGKKTKIKYKKQIKFTGTSPDTANNIFTGTKKLK
jgi:hypothetical protein